MDESFCEAISRACSECHLDGGCCFDARPPLTRERIEILRKNGISEEAIEFRGYKRLRVKADGFCVLFQNGKCTVHEIKPETCVAGPFTFDIKNGTLQIFLKRESICPMVRQLQANRQIYDELFALSLQKIMNLIKAIPYSEMQEILQIEEPETDLVAEIKLPENQKDI